MAKLRALVFVAFLVFLARTSADDSSEKGEHEDGKFNRGRCKFFCFHVPQKNTLVKKADLQNLSCSHLVYGFAHINSRYELIPATNYDNPNSYPDQSEGNFQRITSIGHLKAMKVLFGVKHTTKSGNLENTWTHDRITRDIVWLARFGNFDGIFLDIETQQSLLSRTFEMFMKKLADEVNKDFAFYKKNERIKDKMMVVLGVSARWSNAVRRKVSKYEQYFNMLYLWSDDIPTATSQSKAVQVDPLSTTSEIVKEDTIKYNAEKLASSGIKRERIIIGFTGWARSYIFDDWTEPKHGAFIASVGEPGNVTQRTDGRLAYQEICKVEGFGNVTYDEMAATTSFSGPNGLWYSFNAPNDNIKSKLKWVSSYGFGGVGVFSVQADDELGECGQGPFPLHKYISDHFQCSVRRVDEERGNEACTRLCGFNPDRATNSFSFSSLDPNWCSHIVLTPVNIQSNGEMSVSTAFRKAVIDFNAWSSTAKPYLLLSIGAEQQSTVWRLAISDQRRATFIANLLKMADDFGADGLDISWTSILSRAQDTELLSKLMTELRANVTTTKELLVSVSYKSTFANRYEYQNLSQYVLVLKFIKVNFYFMASNYVILQGYRFHTYDKHFTGHHSPLFNSDMLTVPTYTIEGMTNTWVTNQVESKKLIVALSAEALTQIFRPSLNRAMVRSIGDPAIPSRSVMTRSNSPGIVTQTELCRILQKKSANVYFINAIGVPYMSDDNEFIAFDDVHSMQIKSVWISMKKLGGIALHGMELDNIAGECPPQNPFPMLKTIARAQVCDKCESHRRELSMQNEKESHAIGPEGNQTDLPSGTCKAIPKFKVVCSYNLVLEDSSEYLTFDEIPYEQCDEIVVESFKLNSNGDISHDQTFKNSVENMTKAIAKKPKSRFIAAIHCFMNLEDFELLSDKLEDIATRILAHLEQYEFDGVELDCSHLLRKESKQKFAKLLTLIQDKLSAAEECPKSLSLRLQPWQTKLKDIYDVNILNQIHSVVLPPSHVITKNHSLVASPLFTDTPNESAIDSTIIQWLKAGIKRERIVLRLPTYGLAKPLPGGVVIDRKQRKLRGDVPEIDPLSQQEICEMIKVNKKEITIMYQSVVMYATTDTEAITFENPQTIGFKTMYAIREKLGGVGLASLNQDDFANVCKKGRFMLLQTIDQTKCKPETSATISKA